MQINFSDIEVLTNNDLGKLNSEHPTLYPFSEEVVAFATGLANKLIKIRAEDRTTDLNALALWLGAVSQMELDGYQSTNNLRVARGTIFHISPGNVPLNFVYSLFAGLLTGNRNIVRLPSIEYREVNIVVNLIKELLESNLFGEMSEYIYLVKYPRNQELNQYFTNFADVRIIWGGDNTIGEIRKAQLPSRSTEITFADRYSFAAINASEYLEHGDVSRVSKAFYNDVYLFDQNACTAPHLLVWVGTESDVERAKSIFWESLQSNVNLKYKMEDISAVNKLVDAFNFAIYSEVKAYLIAETNTIVRIELESLPQGIEQYRGNCGLFYEHTTDSLFNLYKIINRKYQTMAYYGFTPEHLTTFAGSKSLHGVDRIVPLGKTLDFNLFWDGYDLFSALTRNISITY